MTRQALTPTALPTPWATAPALLAFTVEDTVNHSEFVSTSHQVIIIWNSDSSSHNWTLTSVGDGVHARTGDQTQVLAGNSFYVTQVIPVDGWQQANQQVYFQADNALVKFAVITVPG